MLFSPFLHGLGIDFGFTLAFRCSSCLFYTGFGIDIDHLHCFRCSKCSVSDNIDIDFDCFYRFRCTTHIIKHALASILDFPFFPMHLFLPHTIPTRRQAPAASAPHHYRTAATAPQPPHPTVPHHQEAVQETVASADRSPPGS